MKVTGNKQRKKSTCESQLYLRRATRDYGEQRERLQKKEERGKRKNLDTLSKAEKLKGEKKPCRNNVKDGDKRT
jgi:hypothetical protein